MLGRLLKGLLKGLILGSLVGYGLAAAGMAAPSALVAYPVAVVLGVLLAMVAGKPIWAEGARIEVGAKAAAGALLAPGLLALARYFVNVGLPFDPSALPGIRAGGEVALGTFAVTSMAMVGAVLAGFFDADNSPPEPEAEGKRVATSKKRIDADLDEADLEAELRAAEAAEAKAAELEQKKR
ncbi:MAG: hypothetical protein R3B72_21670 [Polyangiaceae bacterium]